MPTQFFLDDLNEPYLPLELTVKIVGYLDRKDIVSLYMTSKAFKKFIDNMYQNVFYRLDPVRFTKLLKESGDDVSWFSEFVKFSSVLYAKYDSKDDSKDDSNKRIQMLISNCHLSPSSAPISPELYKHMITPSDHHFLWNEQFNSFIFDKIIMHGVYNEFERHLRAVHEASPEAVPATEDDNQIELHRSLLLAALACRLDVEKIREIMTTDKETQQALMEPFIHPNHKITPVQFAIQVGNLDALSLFNEITALINKESHGGMIYLAYAINSLNPEVCRFLVDKIKMNPSGAHGARAEDIPLLVVIKKLQSCKKEDNSFDRLLMCLSVLVNNGAELPARIALNDDPLLRAVNAFPKSLKDRQKEFFTALLKNTTANHILNHKITEFFILCKQNEMTGAMQAIFGGVMSYEKNEMLELMKDGFSKHLKTDCDDETINYAIYYLLNKLSDINELSVNDALFIADFNIRFGQIGGLKKLSELGYPVLTALYNKRVNRDGTANSNHTKLFHALIDHEFTFANQPVIHSRPAEESISAIRQQLRHFLIHHILYLQEERLNVSIKKGIDAKLTSLIALYDAITTQPLNTENAVEELNEHIKAIAIVAHHKLMSKSLSVLSLGRRKEKSWSDWKNVVISMPDHPCKVVAMATLNRKKDSLLGKPISFEAYQKSQRK